MIAHRYSRASGQEDVLVRKFLVVTSLHEFHETCHSVTFCCMKKLIFKSEQEVHFTTYYKGGIAFMICGKMKFLLSLESKFFAWSKMKWNDKFHGFHDQQCYVMLCYVIGELLVLLNCPFRSAWISTHAWPPPIACQLNGPVHLLTFLPLQFYLKKYNTIVSFFKLDSIRYQTSYISCFIFLVQNSTYLSIYLSDWLTDRLNDWLTDWQ